jgi:hypothetical protein
MKYKSKLAETVTVTEGGSGSGVKGHTTNYSHEDAHDSATHSTAAAYHKNAQAAYAYSDDYYPDAARAHATAQRAHERAAGANDEKLSQAARDASVGAHRAQPNGKASR